MITQETGTPGREQHSDAGFTVSNQTLAVLPAPSVRTVSRGIRRIRTEIKVKLAACNNSPGTAMRRSVECQNAAEAKSEIDMDRISKRKPAEPQMIASA